VARERAAGRLDLARGDPLGLERLEPVVPERKRNARVAIPLIRPLCALRNFVRIGCSMASNPCDP